MNHRGYELEDWKQATREAVETYLNQPCMANAQKMLEITRFWPHHEMRNECGTLLAITEECRQAGIFPTRFTYLMYWLFFQIGRFLTQRDRTWNDYWSLRWTFRSDKKCVWALHDRCHAGNRRDRSHTARAIHELLADKEFSALFMDWLLKTRCRRCYENFFGDDQMQARVLRILV